MTTQWPKAHYEPSPEEQAALERQRDFEAALQHYHAKLTSAVSGTKPYTDFVSAVALNAGLSAIFFGLMESMDHYGWSDRKALAMVLCFIIWYKLLSPLVAATDAAAEITMLHIARKLRWPFPHNFKSANLRAIWFGTTVFLTFLVPFGTGLIGYEFARTIAERVAAPRPGEAPKPLARPAHPTS